MKSFLGFSGFIEQRLIPEFQHFLRRGAAPNPHLIPVVVAATTVLRQLGRSLERGHFLTILSVFLHFPCASQGAIFLITSCTLSITKYNKMA